MRTAPGRPPIPESGVRTNACNSGSYQQFEVFNGSVAGTVVLKSLGIWQNKGLHRCIQVDDDGDTITPHPCYV
ncbi:hypothetical protein [Krasilnikovia sp. MM14-A1259]|uniref:hypothetical protein n=1 Tax=Krasilnikovia sp. MM14-A1259 TaxID=3373539 RepID=UPI0038237DB6